MMIKNAQLYLLLLLISTSVWGQTKEKRMSFERLKALKINYIIEQVDLNTEEESFVWSAFDKYEKTVYIKYNKKMKLKRFLLRFHPPGIILEYLKRSGEIETKSIDLLNLTPG